VFTAILLELSLIGIIEVHVSFWARTIPGVIDLREVKRKVDTYKQWGKDI